MFCRFYKSHNARPALLYQPLIHESTQRKRYQSYYRGTCHIHFVALLFLFLWYLFAVQGRSKAATKQLSRIIIIRDCIPQRRSTFLRELQAVLSMLNLLATYFRGTSRDRFVCGNNESLSFGRVLTRVQPMERFEESRAKRWSTAANSTSFSPFNV